MQALNLWVYTKVMNDIQKMFQALINGQSAFRQEVLSRFDKLDKKLSGRIDQVEKNLTARIDQVDEKLTKRIDNLGRQLAYLEDDTPTREEYNRLEKRVDILEQKAISA